MTASSSVDISALEAQFPEAYPAPEATFTAAFAQPEPGGDAAPASGEGFTLEAASCPTYGSDTARWNVLDDRQQVLGVVAQSGGRRIGRGGAAYTQVTRYRIVTAGPLVVFDQATSYPSVNAAARAVVKARAADRRHVRDETGLTQFERDVLDFEEKFMFLPPGDGARLRAISELLDITATRYYQLLGDLIRPSDPRAMAALAYSPTVVHRLQRLRAARRAHRRLR